MARVAGSGLNGWPFTMPSAASMPSQSGSARLLPSVSTSALSWSKALEASRGSMFTGHAGRIGILHRLRAGLFAERIDFRALHERDRGRQVVRVLIERTQEYENVVGGGAIDEVALGRRLVVAGRQDQELAALAAVRSGQTDVAEVGGIADLRAG